MQSRNHGNGGSGGAGPGSGRPLAEGEKDQRIREADGYQLKRINEAEGDVARFNALLAEYKKAPEVTRRRLYLQSEAYRQVEEIRGVADATATEIYASAYNQSPQAVSLYEFTRTMQAYRFIVAENTTLVLSTDSDLFQFLKGMNPQDQP